MYVAGTSKIQREVLIIPIVDVRLAAERVGQPVDAIREFVLGFLAFTFLLFRFDFFWRHVVPESIVRLMIAILSQIWLSRIDGAASPAARRGWVVLERLARVRAIRRRIRCTSARSLIDALLSVQTIAPTREFSAQPAFRFVRGFVRFRHGGVQTHALRRRGIVRLRAKPIVLF